jgi:hypothetical protein
MTDRLIVEVGLDKGKRRSPRPAGIAILMTEDWTTRLHLPILIPACIHPRMDVDCLTRLRPWAQRRLLRLRRSACQSRLRTGSPGMPLGPLLAAL